MNSSLKLRTAGLQDFASIREVVHEVWPIAYKDVITSEQIEYMLRMMYDDASLMHQLKDEGCEFLIADKDDHTIGFASYSETIPEHFKLHKLYILTSEQGSGAGKQLLKEVCRKVQMRSGKSLELQVNKKNTKAIEFYQRNGFVNDHEAVFDIGNGFVMDDYIMIKKLT